MDTSEVDATYTLSLTGSSAIKSGKLKSNDLYDQFNCLNWWLNWLKIFAFDTAAKTSPTYLLFELKFAWTDWILGILEIPPKNSWANWSSIQEHSILRLSEVKK